MQAATRSLRQAKDMGSLDGCCKTIVHPGKLDLALGGSKQYDQSYWSEGILREGPEVGLAIEPRPGSVRYLNWGSV